MRDEFFFTYPADQDGRRARLLQNGKRAVGEEINRSSLLAQNYVQPPCPIVLYGI